MYETYTRYILTAWFSGRRNASLSLSPSLFRPLSFSCIFHAPRSLSAPTIFAARWREKTCLLLLLLLYEILHRLASSYAPPRRNGYIFSNENSYSLNSILTRHFTIRCEWSTICVPFLGSLRENERNRDLKKLFRFVTRVILIINHHFHSYSTYILI